MMHTVFETIGHRKLPLENLVRAEDQIMKQLAYQLNSCTFFDLAIPKLSIRF